jgi:transposase
MVRDPHTGKYRRTRLFILTLGCSRKSVRLLVWRSSSRVWAELHERAFRRLGGVPRLVVLDNLREGVLCSNVYEPELNPLYPDVLLHYGAVAMPCRVRDPDRKCKVESAIGHTQRTPLRGQRFERVWSRRKRTSIEASTGQAPAWASDDTSWMVIPVRAVRRQSASLADSPQRRD